MISTPHRQTARLLINEAITAGARRAKACAALEISDRTLRRCTKDGQAHADQRPLVPRPEPRNKLSDEERATIPTLCNSTEFASLPPSQIVPKLADQGRYPASESSFYRILRSAGQQQHRGRAKPPVRRKPPTSYKASTPCEVSFSRMKTCAVMQRDMKGAAMKTTMKEPGITASCSRPRVSNDQDSGRHRFEPAGEALLRGAVPRLQIPPGLADQWICQESRCPRPG